ncbi:MAG TPA: hypothetical protein VKS79_12470 [Gemmataceae bacterium]|nr:hypothetical protein [Gemmataceae bacterium]
MGASPYWYVVKYKSDIEAALQELRQREFSAGRYNPVIPFPPFPATASSPAPGCQHATMEEAMEDADADGTHSILDIFHIADEPDFCCATPLSEERMHELYGTTQPTRELVERNMDFLEEVDRGHAVYLILFKDGKPNELMFAGYSFD